MNNKLNQFIVVAKNFPFDKLFKSGLACKWNERRLSMIRLPHSGGCEPVHVPMKGPAVYIGNDAETEYCSCCLTIGGTQPHNHIPIHTHTYTHMHIRAHTYVNACILGANCRHRNWLICIFWYASLCIWTLKWFISSARTFLLKIAELIPKKQCFISFLGNSSNQIEPIYVSCLYSTASYSFFNY